MRTRTRSASSIHWITHQRAGLVQRGTSVASSSARTFRRRNVATGSRCSYAVSRVRPPSFVRIHTHPSSLIACFPLRRLPCVLIWKFRGPTRPAGTGERGRRKEGRPQTGCGRRYSEGARIYGGSSIQILEVLIAHQKHDLVLQQ